MERGDAGEPARDEDHPARRRIYRPGDREPGGDDAARGQEELPRPIFLRRFVHGLVTFIKCGAAARAERTSW
jgi:hypothetical protein